MASFLSTLNESELIAKVLTHDEQAFEEMVNRYHTTMRTVAYSIIGDALADEIVQEAWISVIKSLKHFEGRASLKTWLTRIVANGAKTRLKKESRHISLDSFDNGADVLFSDQFLENGHWANPPSSWSSDSPEENLYGGELNDCMHKHFSMLPDLQQTILTMRDQDDMDLQDISNILDVSSSNVRVALHRARTKLLQMVDTYQREGTC